MPLVLADHIFCAEAGGQLVLLDLEHSRYLGIPNISRRDLTCPTSLAAFPQTLRRIEALHNAGILVDASRGQPCVVRTVAASPDRSLPTAAVGLRGLPVSTIALALQIQSVLWVRRWPLSATIARLRRAKEAAAVGLRVGGEQAIAARIAGFRQSHRIVSPQDRCLLKSVALFRLLVGIDAKVEFVIGVRTAPFAAHAWVQREGALLDDELDRVRLFTPILSV